MKTAILRISILLAIVLTVALGVYKVFIQGSSNGQNADNSERALTLIKMDASLVDEDISQAFGQAEPPDWNYLNGESWSKKEKDEVLLKAQLFLTSLKKKDWEMTKKLVFEKSGSRGVSLSKLKAAAPPIGTIGDIQYPSEGGLKISFTDGHILDIQFSVATSDKPPYIKNGLQYVEKLTYF